MFRQFGGYLTYIGCGLLAISGLMVIHFSYDMVTFSLGFGIEGVAVIALGFYRRLRHAFYRGGNLNNPYNLGEESMMRFG